MRTHHKVACCALSLLALGACDAPSPCEGTPSIAGSPQFHTGEAELSGTLTVPTDGSNITDGWLLKLFLRGDQADCDQVISSSFDNAHEADACGPTFDFTITGVAPGDYTVVLCATAPEDHDICSDNWDADQVVTATSEPNTDLELTFSSRTSAEQSCL